MIRFEDLRKGAHINGLSFPDPARIIDAEPAGSNSYQVIFVNGDGNLDQRLVYDWQLPGLEPASKPEWTFTGDGAKFRLALEAERIRLAHLFDSYMAVSSSAVEPLPHQIAAVYQEMLPRLPLRYVLADDPGAGKTIMTGLLAKELMVRGALQRCLIVTPGSLAEQWHDELAEKFGLHFALLSSDSIYSAASGNPFKDNPLLIARLDVLVRNDGLRELLKKSSWDLIVCDEAHKMSASKTGRKINRTKRYELGELLAGLTEHFLLLTATPHNGKEADFQLFMSLIDPDRFDVSPAGTVEPADISDVMRRLVKEDLLRFDGTPLFPPRDVHTLKYSLSPDERNLYRAVTAYVRDEFNRAERLSNSKKNAVGFALTLLQRRLASSPEAIYRSLVRRKERLQERLGACRPGTDFSTPRAAVWKYDDDDFSSQEAEQQSDEIITSASAAINEAELQAEIETLQRLAAQAEAVRASGTDRKWQELSALLQDPALLGPDGHREKLIIFTEHRDTIAYLKDRIAQLIGTPDAIATIHGGLDRRARKAVETEFKNNPAVEILLATDAAGEGINLQVSHLMVNYDLPWNPNRLEQRFGRIHRIGQDHACHLWNLVSGDTRGGQVFEVLLTKLEQQRSSLPGNVFDVLGKVEWEGQSLRELLIAAVRSESSGKVKAEVLPVLEASLDPERLRKLMQEQVLTDDFMDQDTVQQVREEMERAEARRLQPFYVQSFFQEAMRDLGGRIAARGKGCFEITRLPRAMQQSDSPVPVATRYASVCFNKADIPENQRESTELIAPGSPLLDNLLHSVTDRYRDVLKSGAVLIDEENTSSEIRLLLAVEDSITDSTQDAKGRRRVVSSELAFVELTEDGTARRAGAAPYLDYRPVRPEEKSRVDVILSKESWIQDNISKRADDYMADHIVPDHLQRVQTSTLSRLQKIEAAVEKRLRAEIDEANRQTLSYEYGRNAARKNAPAQAAHYRQRREELDMRLTNRRRQLQAQKDLSSTDRKILAAAVIVPAKLISPETAEAPQSPPSAMSRKEIERAAMDAVMQIERSLGYEPRDVSGENVGYDIESWIPEDLRGEDGAMLRFIEVKGRAPDADQVTLTRNELTTALNQPEQFLLAIVEVDPAETTTAYLKRPFRNQPDFDATSSTYTIQGLKKRAETVLEVTLPRESSCLST